MPHTILTPTSPAPEDPAIARAADLLRAGLLVAIPTETVYGLAARADSDDAAARVFAAKGRPPSNPLIVHVANEVEAMRWVGSWTEDAHRIAEAFWPGPATVVVRGPIGISPLVLAGGDTIALRVPAHPVTRALLEATRLPLAAPSANRSGELSPTRASDVESSLSHREVAAILDGGTCGVGIESSVIDLSGGEPVLLRPGAISADEFARVLGRPVAVHSPLVEHAPKSPGMMGRHYAPPIPVGWLEEEWTHSSRPRPGECVILFGERSMMWTSRVFVLPRRADHAAARLYQTLREAVATGADSIRIERPPEGGEWDGVRDRLTRAAMPAAE